MSKVVSRQREGIFFRTRSAHRAKRTSGGRFRSGSESGDTLIEVLVAIMVLGLTGVALVGAFGAIIGGSAEHRGLATIDTVLKNFAESATYQIQLKPSPLFMPCATLSGQATSSTHISYADSAGNNATAIAYQPPVGYTVQIKSVQYLVNNTSFSASGCSLSYEWPQLITATATGPKGTSKDLSFVVAYPLVETYTQPPPTTTTVPPTTTTTVPPTTTTTVPSTTTTSISKKMHVSSMSGSTDGDKHGWDALVNVRVVDANGTSVAGVVVNGIWGSSVSTSTTSCTTDAAGSCQVEDGYSQLLGSSQKSESFTVTGLTLSGYTYDSAANFASPPSATVGQP
jgi:hypothetical protein